MVDPAPDPAPPSASDPVGALPAMRELPVADAADLDALLRQETEPFVVRGLVADWPLVAAGRQSAAHARAYLLGHRRDVPFTVSVGTPGSGGRLFYDGQMQMNFRSTRGMLPEVFAKIDATEHDPAAHPIYLGSVDIGNFFPGLGAANHVDLGERQPLASIWMGTRTRIAAHNDLPDNLACVAVGRRRFTVFPREQFRNLYLGPVDNTPAGRPISMVDFHAPDFDRFPRFAEALDHARVADLQPGDAVYIPALWWHHVEGLSPFNVLVNYWWRDTPAFLGPPHEALNMAILALRDLPEDEKRYWRDLFSYYVFDNGGDAVDHIPPGTRGILDPLTPETAGRLRAFLLRGLGR